MGHAQAGTNNTPLQDITLINTRAQTQSEGLTESLSELGAHVLEIPMISFEAPQNTGPIAAALSQIENFDWIIFTSVNAVEHFFSYAKRGGKSAEDITAKIASVGKATSASLKEHGLNIDLLASGQATAEGLITAFSQLYSQECNQTQHGCMQGIKVLMPRAQKAREVLPAWLTEQGARLLVAPVYQTVAPGIRDDHAECLAGAISQPQHKLGVIFTSPSTFNNFVAALTERGESPDEFAKQTVAFSVGPVTTAAIKKRGLEFKDLVEASESYIASLISAIVDYYAE